METVYSLLKTTRPINVILALLSSVISLFSYNFLTTSNITCIYYHPTILYGFLVIIFYTAAANTINDLYDIESDKINHPNRPLASNSISKNNVIIFLFLLIILGLLCTLKINKNAFYFANLLILPSIAIYTPYLKKLPLIGNIVISMILGSVFLFTQLLLINQISDWILFSLAFSLSMIRELAKDMADINGDMQNQIMTFPCKYGLKKSLSMIYALFVILVIITLVPIYYNPDNYLYLLTLIIIIYTPLLLGIFSLQKNLTIKSAKLLSKTTKQITFAGIITILLLDINIL